VGYLQLNTFDPQASYGGVVVAWRLCGVGEIAEIQWSLVTTLRCDSPQNQIVMVSICSRSLSDGLGATTSFPIERTSDLGEPTAVQFHLNRLRPSLFSLAGASWVVGGDSR